MASGRYAGRIAEQRLGGTAANNAVRNTVGNMRTAAQNLAAIPATREGLAALPTYLRDPADLRVGRGSSFLDQLHAQIRAQQMFGSEALARSRQPNFIDQAQANARQAARARQIEEMFGSGARSSKGG